MRRTESEFAPRGTWIDDSASEHDLGPRRSVTVGVGDGPYRDASETLRARRKALEAELASVDETLRALPPSPRPSHRAGVWALRVLAWPIVVAMGLVAFDHFLVLATRPALVVDHGSASGSARPVFAHERASDAPRPRRDVARLGPRRYVIARALVERVLDGSGDAPVSPIVERGEVTGLRVLNVAPGSALDALGVRSEDVIVAVDEHWLHAPDGAALAFEAARTRDHFTLVVQRGRARVLLEYEVIG